MLAIYYPTGSTLSYISICNICLIDVRNRSSPLSRTQHHAPQDAPERIDIMTLYQRSGPKIFEGEYIKDHTLVRRLWGGLLALLGPQHRSRQRDGHKAEPAPRSRVSRTLPFLLIALWFFTLWWGERVTFRRSANRCVWDRWEDWVSFPWC